MAIRIFCGINVAILIWWYPIQVCFISIHPGTCHRVWFNFSEIKGKQRRQLNNQQPIIICGRTKKAANEAFHCSFLLLLFVHDNNRCNRSLFHFYQQWLTWTFAVYSCPCPWSYVVFLFRYTYCDYPNVLTRVVGSWNTHAGFLLCISY